MKRISVLVYPLVLMLASCNPGVFSSIGDSTSSFAESSTTFSSNSSASRDSSITSDSSISSESSISNDSSYDSSISFDSSSEDSSTTDVVSSSTSPEDSTSSEVVPSYILSTRYDIYETEDEISFTLIRDTDNQEVTDYSLSFISGENILALVSDNTYVALSQGTVDVIAIVEGIESNEISFSVVSKGYYEISLSVISDRLDVGESTSYSTDVYPRGDLPEPEVEIIYGNECGYVDFDVIHATEKGVMYLQSRIGSISSPAIEIRVGTYESESFVIFPVSNVLTVGETTELLDYMSPYASINYRFVEGSSSVSVSSSGTVTALSKGTATIEAVCAGVTSEPVTIEVVEEEDNPYLGISKDEFYSDYHVATSSKDAYFRSSLGLMSGSIEVPEQENIISPDLVMHDDVRVRDIDMHYSDSMSTYTVFDAYGNESYEVYRTGAYITIEEVASYVYAFQDIPRNYDPVKSHRNPTQSIWGEYLRLNNSQFTGNVDRYPYEPRLPDISGIGGSLQYYEIDIGTTGTDCDPSYDSVLYNNGVDRIERGAARIVYARYNADGSLISNPYDRYVFYTYNHYNDFQEYLNYKDGWGEMFGNITGGGEISSYDPLYPPTDYVVSLKASLPL